MKKSELKAIITEMAERIEELEAERVETVTITFPPVDYYPPPVKYEYPHNDWWMRPVAWYGKADSILAYGSQG